MSARLMPLNTEAWSRLSNDFFAMPMPRVDDRICLTAPAVANVKPLFYNNVKRRNVVEVRDCVESVFGRQKQRQHNLTYYCIKTISESVKESPSRRHARPTYSGPSNLV
jgi:hypothetical protein